MAGMFSEDGPLTPSVYDFWHNLPAYEVNKMIADPVYAASRLTMQGYVNLFTFVQQRMAEREKRDGVTMTQKGDWVSAQVAGTSNVIEGVYINDLGDDVEVENRAGIVRCQRQGMYRLPDPDFSDVQDLLRRVRQLLGNDV